MSILDKDRKTLWGKSGNRCAICKEILVWSEDLQQQSSIIGDECHIVGQRAGSARNEDFGNSIQMHSYTNLILLCKNHHKLIDDQTTLYTSEYLHLIKNAHEKWVFDTLNFTKSFEGFNIVSKSLYNGGLKNLTEINLSVDYSLRTCFGVYHTRFKYSDYKQDHLSYRFTGTLIEKHLLYIDFGEEILPYETDPSLDSFGSKMDIWRLTRGSNNSYRIFINSFGYLFGEENWNAFILEFEENESIQNFQNI